MSWSKSGLVCFVGGMGTRCPEGQRHSEGRRGCCEEMGRAASQFHQAGLGAPRGKATSVPGRGVEPLDQLALTLVPFMPPSTPNL